MKATRRSPGCDRARLNALYAVELDPVRLHDRFLDVRLAAAVRLAPCIEVCEALLLGIPVPSGRVEAGHASATAGHQDVVLDEELAWTVSARGPAGVRP